MLVQTINRIPCLSIYFFIMILGISFHTNFERWTVATGVSFGYVVYWCVILHRFILASHFTTKQHYCM